MSGSLASFKLGRLPAPPDLLARAPSLRGHRMASAPAPTRLDRSSVPFQPALDDNDVLGDCTAVGIANAARGQAALYGYELAIPTARVVSFYAASTGYDPTAPLVNGENPTDRGGVEVEVLAYQATHGLRTGADLLVADWGMGETGDLNALRSVAAASTLPYLGVNLALADQQAPIWDTVTPAAYGDPTPGSWGAHCLALWDYEGTDDLSLVRLATWGTLRQATWRWVRSRLEEWHALWFRQIVAARALAGSGIDMERLRAEQLAFSAPPALAPGADGDRPSDTEAV